ncbi:LuxR C-terminal-related transcriptional regulator [Nocardioides montaniterrae]
MEPTDTERRAWAEALRRLRAASGVGIGFGGSVDAGTLHLGHFDGARTGALKGLEIVRGRGLGGRSWHERTPIGVPDYSRAEEISHHYDGPVRAEGLRAVVAAPVVLGGAVRGVLYAGARDAVGYGDRLLDAVARTGLWLARELAVEDEVNRRIEERTAQLRRLEATATERLRRAQAGLCHLRATTSDPTTRDAADRLLGDLAPQPTAGSPLSSRETDVLAQVATGATYAVVGERLGLSAQTVKSYMRDILVRLDAHSRHEAIVVARTRGLLP